MEREKDKTHNQKRLTSEAHKIKQRDELQNITYS